MVEPNIHRHTHTHIHIPPKDKHPFSEILWFESRKNMKNIFLMVWQCVRFLSLGQCFILAVSSEECQFFFFMSPEWIFQACLNIKELKTERLFIYSFSYKKMGPEFWHDSLYRINWNHGSGLPFSSLPDPGEGEEGGKGYF